MQTTSYLVRAVPGRLVPHPGSIGGAQASKIGHRMRVDHEDPDTRRDVFTGQMRVVPLFEPLDEDVLVREVDHYLLTAIKDGDLDYVATVLDAGTKREARSVDPSLAKITSQHRAARAAAEPAEAAAEPHPSGASAAEAAEPPDHILSP